MIELPESYTIAKQINEYLTGKVISYVEKSHTPHRFAFFNEDSDRFIENIEGQEIVGAVHHAGIIEVHTENRMLTLHDGAYPKYYADKKLFPKTHQLAIYFDDGTAVFVSVQMYGFIGVFPKGICEDGYYISSVTKPDPLSEGFTLGYFKSLYPIGKKKLSAKAFLATEQRIPGLGNGVLQDILWEAGIDPRFDMVNASEDDYVALYNAIEIILQKMCEDSGRDTERDLFGNNGNYISQLSKKSLFEPCMKCGTEIQKANYMGGTVYFCEKCQKR